MPRAAWMTDIHFEFLPDAQIDSFLTDICTTHQPDMLFISGDIGDAGRTVDYLRRIHDVTGLAVYFVLGNHDYYGGDVPQIRKEMRAHYHDHQAIHWLPDSGVVRLSEKTALVGHGGWSDGGYGDFMASEIILNDYVQIASLVTPSKAERFEKLQRFGADAAATLRQPLLTACADYKKVIVVTHSPPFIEACWHEGKTPTSDDPYLPHFTCKAIGDLLLETAETHPQTQITVLCGHTHGGGEAHIRPNLHVITGPAEYGHPVVQRVLEL
jgi:predicted MPP superfamily phosphohydrolase